jgi:SRSO17 transposase
VLRDRDRDNQQVVQMDFSLSNAAPETPLWQLARVAKAEHRIEACLQRSKSEAGLADYEIRHWMGWQPHQTLSLHATWFLGTETLRGKNRDASDDGTAATGGHRDGLGQRVSMRDDITYAA